MRTFRKAALLAALAAMIIAPLAGGSAGAASAPVTNCLTTAYVTSTNGGVPGPRAFVTPGPPGDGTISTVVYFCAGGANGVQVSSGVASTNDDHCLNSFPGVPATHAPADPATDEVAYLPLCATPIGVDHIGPNPNGVSLLGGPTCGWTTNGHAWFTYAGLDLDNFTCNNGFGGTDTKTRSNSLAVLIFNPLFNLDGSCPTVSICWLNAVSEGHFTAVDPSPNT